MGLFLECLPQFSWWKVDRNLRSKSEIMVGREFSNLLFDSCSLSERKSQLYSQVSWIPLCKKNLYFDELLTTRLNVGIVNGIYRTINWQKTSLRKSHARSFYHFPSQIFQFFSIIFIVRNYFLYSHGFNIFDMKRRKGFGLPLFVGEHLNGNLAEIEGNFMSADRLKGYANCDENSSQKQFKWFVVDDHET